MKLRGILFVFLLLGLQSNAQVCPVISSPKNAANNVPVDAVISWNQVTGISGYLISLGSSPGSTEILNSRSAAFDNSVKPLVGLPSNTEVFVTISLFQEDGTLITCPGESFMTENVTIPPPCTTLSSPMNNSPNANPAADIEWHYAYGATGYRLTIGTTKGGHDILNDFDVGNVLSFNPSNILPINSEIYVRIVPYNDEGNNGPCNEEHFTTGDTTVNCLEYIPEISIPDTIGICGNEATIYSSQDFAEGFRWYKINNDNTETLISESREVGLSDIGRYRYEAYRNISVFDQINECSVSKEFSVVKSEPAIIRNVKLEKESSGVRMSIEISGNGAYEYAMDNPRGPFQNQNEFANISNGNHLIYVRDRNGCGTTEYLVTQKLKSDDFPEFFTPNGDGINEYWQYNPTFKNQLSVQLINIFDRYGNLLVQLEPNSQGWNGIFNGKQMPETDYWFMAMSFDGQNLYGHFTLKR